MRFREPRPQYTADNHPRANSLRSLTDKRDKLKAKLDSRIEFNQTAMQQGRPDLVDESELDHWRDLIDKVYNPKIAEAEEAINRYLGIAAASQTVGDTGATHSTGGSGGSGEQRPPAPIGKYGSDGRAETERLKRQIETDAKAKEANDKLAARIREDQERERLRRENNPVRKFGRKVMESASNKIDDVKQGAKRNYDGFAGDELKEMRQRDADSRPTDTPDDSGSDTPEPNRQKADANTSSGSDGGDGGQ